MDNYDRTKWTFFIGGFLSIALLIIGISSGGLWAWVFGIYSLIWAAIIAVIAQLHNRDMELMRVEIWEELDMNVNGIKKEEEENLEEVFQIRLNDDSESHGIIKEGETTHLEELLGKSDSSIPSPSIEDYVEDDDDPVRRDDD